MSIWTHVVGTIRVDGIPGIIKIEDLEKILGKIIKYTNILVDDSDEETTLPMGSEGSLRYQIIEYDKGFRWVVIPVWGDLRDYDDVTYIEEWWNGVLEKLPVIRDACLRIEVEGQKPVLLWTKEQ